MTGTKHIFQRTTYWLNKSSSHCVAKSSRPMKEGNLLKFILLRRRPVSDSLGSARYESVQLATRTAGTAKWARGVGGGNHASGEPQPAVLASLSAAG